MKTIESVSLCAVATAADQNLEDACLLELQLLELALVGGGSGDVQF